MLCIAPSQTKKQNHPSTLAPPKAIKKQMKGYCSVLHFNLSYSVAPVLTAFNNFYLMDLKEMYMHY